MTEAPTGAPVDGLPLAREVRTLGELRGAAMRHRRRTEPLAEVAGAAVAATVVAVEASTAPANALTLTFLVFLLAGTTLGRRPHWSTMLRFTHALMDLLYRAVAAAGVWVVMDATAVAQAPVAALALAAVAATATATLARRVPASASTRIAVVGSARSADQLRRDLLASGVRDQQVVGVVAAASSDDMRGPVPVLGDMDALDEMLQAHEVDMLLIDGEASRIDVFDRLADTCLDLPVRVCELTQFYEDALGHVPVNEIGSAWFRYIMHPRFRSPDTAAKRALDLAVVVVAGIAFLPVLGVCALLIKLYDGGPVLFRQRRIGSRGREFTLLKLRTMHAAPAVVRWSSPDDERVTPIGRLLRRTHLDEIPQLVNVARGEMSVVGPRPEQPEFVERLEHTLPHYSRRHLIKPGLTGWAQVRCGYAGSDTGSEWKLCNDLFYLKHQSLGLDVAILAETARMLVRDRQFSVRGRDGLTPFVSVGTDETSALVPAD
jgi:exopolysaccharide biosynthesis polyprenyl glycosylphosphotransferase